MSLAFPSLDVSTINVSAHHSLGIAARSGSTSRVAYALSLGIAVASIVSAVDLLSVALLGVGTPWIFLPTLLVLYLTGGAMLGVLLSLAWVIVGREKRQPTSDSQYTEHMQRAAHWSLLAGFSVVTLERLLGSNAGYADLSANSLLVLLPIGFLVTIFAIVLLVSQCGIKDDYSGIRISQIAVLGASFVWWAPFNKLYDEPMMSAASLLWNSFYLASCFICYRAVSLLACRTPLRIQLTGTGSCIRSTCLITMIGLTMSSAVWAFNYSTPIDLSPPSQPPNTVTTVAIDMPNVVLIVMDTARADHLSCYGYPKNTTPILSALAKESVIYKHAVSPSPWTLPAHASLFTGMYPREHEAYCHPRDESLCQAYPLPQARQTIAELLSSHGYDTAAVLGNWSVLHRSFGLDQGFSYYDDRPKLAMNSAIPNTLSPARWLSGAWQLIQGQGGSSRSAAEVNASALAWLERPRNQPFLLFVNYLDPHQPYQAHLEFEDQLASAPAYQLDGAKVAKPLFPIRAKLEDDIARYDQELAFVDDQIGKLLDALRSQGLYESSLIIVTSDHGEAFDEHGYLGHSNTVYEEEVHVPLIVRYPHSSRRGVVANTTSLVSVANLITAVVGCSPLNHVATEQSDVQEVVFTERIRWLPKTDPLYGPTTSAVYLNDGMKVLMYETTKIDTRAYDLGADPLERYEIAAQRSDQVVKATSLLEAWFDRLRNRQFAHSNQMRNTQLTENLKTLGYISD